MIKKNLGILHTVDVPWMISPSVSGIKIESWETGDTIVYFNVTIQEGVEPRAKPPGPNPRAKAVFKMGRWATMLPTPLEGETVDYSKYDTTNLPLANCPLENYLEKLEEVWRETQACPNPGIYEVFKSGWGRRVAEGRLRHFILVGHDIKLEILAAGFEWGYLRRGVG